MMLFHFPYSQAEVNIIAGCCMSLGFRYAGTNDPEAYKTLVYNNYLTYIECNYVHILIVVL